ncbi:MAG: hypothetical protein PUB05_02295 [Firmicutes bacterium]|nr:hypothetical protein [Bacillota bacterium]
MNITQLGEEYLQEAERLRRRIDELRVLLKSSRGKEHLQLERQINAYYKMAEDCYNTGTYLKFYYTEGYLSVSKNYRI